MNREKKSSSPSDGVNPRTRTFLVAVDGPAASGKSSVSREVARRFGWRWVSTGAFYRGLALVASREGLDLGDEAGLAALASSAIWSVEPAPENTRVLHRGVDVTEETAREEVGSLASRISSYPAVRAALLEAQRRCALGVSGLVAEGRDCGTVVFPGADVKIFLTARSEDRAARRARDEGASLDATQEAQAVRDAQDASRKAAPMLAAPGAITLNASELNFEQVVARIEAAIRGAQAVSF